MNYLTQFLEYKYLVVYILCPVILRNYFRTSLLTS